MTPTLGQTVDVPTLRWTPGLGTDAYTGDDQEVQRRDRQDMTTSATSYTYDGQDDNRRPAPTLVHPGLVDPWPQLADLHTTSSTSAATAHERLPGAHPPEPDRGHAGVQGAPELTWAPMAGAAYYKVSSATPRTPTRSGSATPTSNLFDAPVPYPSMTEISKRLMLSGTYDWQVEAYNSSDVRIGTGPRAASRSSRSPPPPAQARRSAASSSTPTTPGRRTRARPRRRCTVPTTPVMKWDPDPRVAWYMVYVSEDASFTNLLEPGNGSRRPTTRCTPRRSTTTTTPTPTTRPARRTSGTSGRAARRSLRTRPGVDDRQGPGHVHQALPRGRPGGQQLRRRR